MTTTAVLEHSADGMDNGESITLVLIDGAQQRRLALHPLPFTVGRLAENSLALPQPYVSRLHAKIMPNGEGHLLIDGGSRHGTFVNGMRVERHVLSPGDRMQFGSLQAPCLTFGDEPPEPVTTQHHLLGKLQALSEHTSELSKLRWLLDAARDLNSASALENVLASLIEATLTLTRAERGYVLLMRADGRLVLAAGRDAEGRPLGDSSSLSQTAIRQAAEGGSDYILADTLGAEGLPLPLSVVAHSLRTVICIPLRRRPNLARLGQTAVSTRNPEILGVLYLDSRFSAGTWTGIDNDLLRTIAREAAALVENTQLVAAEEQARQYREELQIASRIQKGLMAVQLPRLEFASIQAQSAPCKEVGGDFFDVITGDKAVSVALVDVSGKGISAAILASTLQGMLYSQLSAAQPLEEIAAVINSYLCAKNVGKYATMVLLRLQPNGRLQYINCGHIQPRLHSCCGVKRLDTSNLPVGLLPDISYQSGTTQLEPGCRVLLVSDGVTEAENAAGEMFGDERLDAALAAHDLNGFSESLRTFCTTVPAQDDCTMVELIYHG